MTLPAVAFAMRKCTAGAWWLLTACSSESVDRVLLEATAQSVERSDGEGAEEDVPVVPMDPSEPVDLPYAIEGMGCSVHDGCDDVVVYSTVSQEELAARRATRALREFELERANNLELFAEVTSRALERAAALVEQGQGASLQKATLYLPEKFFDFRQLRSADAETHARLWQERGDQLLTSQSAARLLVEKLGGKAKASLRLANILYAAVPAGSIEALVRSGIVDGIELGGTPVIPDADGVERRQALSMTPSGFQGLGWDGNQGGKRNAAGPVLFAVIEADGTNNNLNYQWLGWLDSDPPAGNRLLERYFCDDGDPCVVLGGAVLPTNYHGTRVASVLLGDWEDGQGNDNTTSAAWTTGQRRQRGGIASEAEMIYYAANTAEDDAVAIDHAVAANVDIINMSQSYPTGFCANATLEGVRAAIAAATNSGVLTVVTAGNQGDLGANCRVNSFGAVPDSFVVGAVADVDGADALEDLDSVGILAFPPVPPATVTTYSGTSANGETTTIAGGAVVASRAVDIAATGVVEAVADSAFTNTVVGSRTGTSYAAPQVAGAAGVLKDWMYSTGAFLGMAEWINDPYILAVMLATMGDGAWGFAGGVETGYQIDQVTGFGHLRFAPPSPEIIGDTTYAYYRAVPHDTLEEGDTVEYFLGKTTGPEPTQIAGWKFAALIDQDFYGNTPAITFQLIDKCPVGGGTVVVRTATLATHKARIRMKTGDMASKYHNRCLWIRAHVDEADGPFGLYMADYAYTNDRTWHEMTIAP